MKHPWVPYAIVAALAIGAGIAIAGVPDNSPVDATITVTGTTDTSSPRTVPGTAPATSAPPTTTPPSDTTAPPATTTPATTTPAPTTTPPPTTVPELIDRSELVVVAANGTNVGGTASRMAARLEGIGYVDVLPRDGTIVEEFTVVYFVDGFDGEALRLAADLDLLDVFIGPFDTAPNVIDVPEATELLVYTGLDRA